MEEVEDTLTVSLAEGYIGIWFGDLFKVSVVWEDPTSEEALSWHPVFTAFVKVLDADKTVRIWLSLCICMIKCGGLMWAKFYHQPG